MDLDHKKIYDLILADLRMCYQNDSFIASPINFQNYWGRDTFWSLLGMMHGPSQEIEMTKKSLTLFLKFQRKDGKIPRKIIFDFDLLKRIGISIRRPSLFPLYNSPLKTFYSLDENLLFVVAFCKYIDVHNDFDFARRNFDRVARALHFFYDHNLVRNELLYEFGLGNWMDTILKRGHVLYTNCLWFGALENFQRLSEKLDQDDHKQFPDCNYVKKRINDLFWNKFDQYYVDAISQDFKQKEYFDTSANTLALFFGISDQEKSKIICDKIDKLKSEAGLHPINYPAYPFRKVNPLTYIFGIQKYHNGISWSWVEVMIALVFAQNGYDGKAFEIYNSLGKLIVENDGLHETYNLNGTPFDHKLWKSAIPFAWSAGLFLLLDNKLFSQKL